MGRTNRVVHSHPVTAPSGEVSTLLTTTWRLSARDIACVRRCGSDTNLNTSSTGAWISMFLVTDDVIAPPFACPRPLVGCASIRRPPRFGIQGRPIPARVGRSLDRRSPLGSWA